MPHFAIRTTEKTLLYEGRYSSLRRCLESAVAQGICLDRANLDRANLSHANLDNARLRNASLNGANLVGANLSESRLEGSDLSGATLHSACLAFASLRGCRFEDASFGATDVSGADLRGAVFSSLSSFSLNFIDCEDMEGSVFIDPEGLACAMNTPPVVLYGVSGAPIVFLDHHVRVSGQTLRHEDWLDHARPWRRAGHDPGQRRFDTDLESDGQDALLRLLQSVRRWRKNNSAAEEKTLACIARASSLK